MAVKLLPVTDLTPVAGVRLGTTAAALRRRNRRDLVVIELAAGSRVAAVFTRNRFCAAPVVVAREHLRQGPPCALLINTGYANAGTGETGVKDARDCCAALAGHLACRPEQVLPFSTGVIGERLPVARVTAALPHCLRQLSESGWLDAAHGIMTTDTVPKGVSRRFPIGRQTAVLTGIVKGAGMIRPDMATMLAFIATDAALSQSALQESFSQAVEQSFNRITVDGDTSTNDAAVLVATGKCGNTPIDSTSSDACTAFADALASLCSELAQACVRDAEGATKFITIEVQQGASESDCLQVAYTIAHSPLVKTAFFASDPNWGRILAAIGRAAVGALDIDAVSIYLDEVCIVKRGAVDPGYTEERGQAVMRKPEITVRVMLGQGASAARIYTCDLSHDYVRINAEYRT